MIPVDSIPSRYPPEKPEQALRRKEVLEFWESGVEIAEMTIFNPTIQTQSEVEHYKKASRQLRVGYPHIEFFQRKGKIYAKRIGGKEKE